MLAQIQSYGLLGLSGYKVLVELDFTGGLPYYDTVGLPDASVRESKERVRSAIKNSGLYYPLGHVTINLAPADTRKEGSVYDLPIAIGLLAASGQIPKARAEKYMYLGELALDGSIRGIAGILPMVIGAYNEKIPSVILPEQNAAEGAYIEGVEVIPAGNLRDVVQFLNGKLELKPFPKRSWDAVQTTYSSDFSDIKGQQGAKRAAEIAVAGGHNMLLIGTPGSGKTMLARSIPSILPELSFKESLEITKIHSVMGGLKGADGIITERPFRAPHHTASIVSLIGGGPRATPGEISLAHYGVLFLDEFPEYRKEALEALRQPIEDGEVTITRINARSTYPSDFMLVAAMNPCPCGNFGSRINPCRCSPSQVDRYRNKISGPMLDRLDLHVEMSEVGYGDITSKQKGEGSAEIRARVNAARRRQAERYKDEGILFNAQLTNRLTAKYARMSKEAEALLSKAFDSLKLSARAYTRILKVARTIADLDSVDLIENRHIAEAIQYRSLESKYWGSNR